MLFEGLTILSAKRLDWASYVIGSHAPDGMLSSAESSSGATAGLAASPLVSLSQQLIAAGCSPSPRRLSSVVDAKGGSESDADEEEEALSRRGRERRSERPLSSQATVVVQVSELATS